MDPLRNFVGAGCWHPILQLNSCAVSTGICVVNAGRKTSTHTLALIALSGVAFKENAIDPPPQGMVHVISQDGGPPLGDTAGF